MPYWSLHSHSRYSAKDGMSDIKAMVARGVELGYPALGLTDHGTPAGVVQFYLACRKAGVSPLPGIELYFTIDAGLKENASMHLTIAAYTEAGYRNLVRMSTLSAQHFYRRPRLDVADLATLHEAGYTEGLVLATGCRSGPVVKSIVKGDLVAATRVTKSLASMFDRTYVEVMNHGFEAEGISDDDICSALVGIADEVGLPVIVTGDSHYVMAADQARHDAMKELLTWSPNPADGAFHGCGYHLVDEAWLGVYLEPSVLKRGIESLNELAEIAAVRIPELDTFTLKVPDVTLGGDQDDELGGRVLAALQATFPDDEAYAARVYAELDVIRDVGMAGYLLLVAWICDYMVAEAIWFHARGSVAGSLVAHLLGISQVDPIADEIRMDRFLSGDRTLPPDIDLDIQSTRRQQVIAYVQGTYSIRQVAIYSRYSLDEDSDDQTGSLKVEYFSTKRKYGEHPTKDAVIPKADWDMLTDLVGHQLIKNVGTNAAGFLISDNEPELAKLPLVQIGGRGSLVTAYDKYDVELAGFPKIDLLGLKMLDAMAIACGYIAPEDPIGYFNSIPDDDPEALARAGSGDTWGMFQLEGWSQRTGLEELEPAKTIDVIAAQALFRPGVSRQFLGTYMRRRKGQEEIPAAHPDITKELASTYGVAIFQEQVVGVLRDIGMTPVDLTRMLGAIKASGKAGLVKAKVAVAEALPSIIVLAKARGWSEEDIGWLEAALTDYGAGYSFGKGHSTVYGRFAYRTAYLAVHEPLGFWTGVLIAYTGHKNAKKLDMEKAYNRAARSFGIKIKLPHVNASAIDYMPVIDPKDNIIRKGLVSVPGVGRTAATEIFTKRFKGDEEVPYETLKELGQRLVHTKVTGAKDLALGKLPEEIGTGTAIYALGKADALKGLK
jgi:DNA polymerase-3 subunit alpha